MRSIIMLSPRGSEWSTKAATVLVAGLVVGLALLLCPVLAANQAVGVVQGDTVLVDRLFASLQGKTVRQRQRILRDIARLREPASLPHFARLLLDSGQAEPVRREAAKALFTLKGEERMARAFVPLLRETDMSMERTLEAVWHTQDPLFRAPLLQLGAASAVAPTLRKQALRTYFSLWNELTCPAPPEPRIADAPPFIEALQALIDEAAGKKRLKRGRAKALALGACFELRGALSRLIRNYRGMEIDERLFTTYILGSLRQSASIAALGDRSRNDSSSDVRLAALRALSSMDWRKARLQMIRTFNEGGMTEARAVVDLLRDASKGLPILRRLLRREKRPALRAYLQQALNDS